MKPGAIRGAAFAAVFFLGATLLFTWPVAPRAADGLSDLWDAKLNAWSLNWDFHQIFRDPLRLFDANIFHPARYSLAFSENLFGVAVFGFPLYALGVSALAGYNVLFLLGMFLSAMAAWALALYVTRDRLASLIAGLVYAFLPWRLSQVPHLQFQWGAFLPLVLLLLLRYLDLGKPRDAWLLGIFFAWNAAANVHYAVFSGFLVSLVLLARLLAAWERAGRRRVLVATLAIAAGIAAVLPIYVPYMKASALYGMQRGYGEIEFFSARPVDFLTAGAHNRLYAPLTQRWAHPEGDLFPGLTALALAAVALVRLRGPRPVAAAPIVGRRRTWARVLDVLLLAELGLWALLIVRGGSSIGRLRLRDPGRILFFATETLALRLFLAFPRSSVYSDLRDFVRRARLRAPAGLLAATAVLGVVIALGMHTPYYAFLVQSFGPVFRAIRAPSRGIVLFDLALAVLAAWGFSTATGTWPLGRRRIAAAVAILLLGFEYRAFPVDIQSVEARPAPVYRWIAETRMPGAVVEWPLGAENEPEHVFRSTAHWRPLVNGYSGFYPPLYLELEAAVRERPIPSTVWNVLARARACVLVFHPHEAVGDSRPGYVEALTAGVRAGRAFPLRVFPHDGDSDAVFALPCTDGSQLQGEPAGAEAVTRLLDQLTVERIAPFGVLDVPREDQSVRAGTWAYGWALDDSGIESVEASLDGGPPTPAMTLLPHPGIADLYPTMPDSAHAGFGFPVPKGSRGDHVLTVIARARDGGLLQIRRRIRIR